MKFLRAVRFDRSDEQVFARPAPPGEWAVSGAIEFAGAPAEALTGKLRQAFANGFLGVPSFGRTTFAAVSDFTADDRHELEERLASHFLEALGAPDMDEARNAAREEVGFIADLCAEVPVNTIFSVARSLDEDGRVREEFREITPPREGDHARIWEIVEDDA